MPGFENRSFFREDDFERQGNVPVFASSFIEANNQDNPIQTHAEMVEYILSQCSNVQSLIIADPLYTLSLTSHLSGSQVLMPFLSHSLKRLYIPIYAISQLPPSSISVKNLVWILLFCKSLKQVVLGVNVAPTDEKFLKEFHETFKSRSEAQQVAIAFYFTWSHSKSSPLWKGGSRRSEVVYHFLKIFSDKLSSLELSINTNPRTINVKGTDSAQEVCVDSISGLEGSFSSLKHLRMMCFTPDFERRKLTDLTRFINMKILAIEGSFLQTLCLEPDFKFPPNLEIIQIPFHRYEPIPNQRKDTQEDKYISQIIESQNSVSTRIPKLKQIVVPFQAVSMHGELPKYQEQTDYHRFCRNEFGKEPIVRSGRVKLRQLERGESVGEGLEKCLSNHGFLSSFPA